MGNQEVKIFDATNCNGNDLPYTIYHIYGSISIPTFREIGTFQSGNLSSFNQNLIKAYTIDGLEINPKNIKSSCPVEIYNIKLEQCKRDYKNKFNTFLIICGVFVLLWIISLYFIYKLRKSILYYRKKIEEFNERSNNYTPLQINNLARN